MQCKPSFNALNLFILLLFLFPFNKGYSQVRFQKSTTNNYGLVSIKQDSKNYYFAAGYDSFAYIQKLNSSGVSMWNHRYNAKHYYDLTIDLNDNVVAVGDNSSSQFLVNSLGTGKGIRFNKKYAASGVAKSIDYTLNASGKTSGYIIGGQKSGYPYVVKINTQGTVLWEKQLNYNTGSGAVTGIVTCIRRTYDGGYITVAAVSGGSVSTIVTKFDSSNTVSWSYAYTFATFPSTTPAQINKVIQTDDNADGAKDDGYVISDYSNGFLIKIKSNGTLDWSSTAYSYTDTYLGPSIRPNTIMQDNNGYLLVGTNLQSVMRINFISSSHTVTTPSRTATNFFHERYTSTDNVYDLIQSNDNGYMALGNGLPSGMNYFVKTDGTGVSSTTLCNEATGIGTFGTIGITASNVTTNTNLGTLTVDSGSVTLSTTTYSVAFTTNCSLTCTTPATPVLTSQQCDSLPDTLTVTCSSPGVDITWYRRYPGYGSAVKIDSGTNTIVATTDSSYFAVVSYGTCSSKSDTLNKYSTVLNPGFTLSSLSRSILVLATCHGGVCSNCTSPLTGVQIWDPNSTLTSPLPSGLIYKWYSLSGSTKTLLTVGGDGSKCRISMPGSYEVTISNSSGLCQTSPLMFNAIIAKPTITGATECDMTHKVTASGSGKATLTANLNVTPDPSNTLHYHWYWHSLNPARSHAFSLLPDTTQIIVNKPPGVYYVEYSDDSNKCYSYTDTITFTSPDTGIHANFDFDKIHCTGGHAATIVCQNETAPSIYGSTVIQPIFYTWKVNGVTKEVDFTNSDFSYYPIHKGDTVTLEVTDSGYCIHSISKIVSDTPFTTAPTITAFDGYYNGSTWVSTSAYGTLPCGRKHQIRVTGTNLDDMSELSYLPAANAIFGDSIVSDNPHSFERIYTVDSNYTGTLIFYVTNSSCIKDSATAPINYDLRTDYDRISKANYPSGQDMYIIEGTPAFDIVKGDYIVNNLPLATLSPATAKIFKSGVLHNPGTTTAGILYSLNPTAAFPDNIFNAASDSITSDTARNKTYDIDVYFHASSAAGPPVECDSKPDRLHIHVLRPIVKVSNTRYCAGTSSTVVSISIKNFPVDTFLYGGFDVSINLYDAANNKLNTSALAYNTYRRDSIAFTYTIPTTYGDSFYIEATYSVPGWFTHIPSVTFKKPYRLTGGYLAHTIDFQQLIGGTYKSVSGGDTVCISGGQFPDIKTLITPRSESLSGGTYTYQWYDSHGTAIAGDSGRIHNHLCDTFSLPIFHAATAAASYTYPFHVIVTELAGSGTLCSGTTGTGHGCAVSKTLKYIDNTPQGISIAQASTYFCGSTMQLYATYNSHYSYQWQEYVNGTWTSNFNNAGGATRDTLVINHTGTYQCIITNTKPAYASCPAYSNALTITAPVLTIIDHNNAFVVGSSSLEVDLSVVSYFSSPYQWYYISATGSAPTAVSGAISNSLNPTSAGYYYLKASLSSCGSGTVYSNMLYISAGTSCTSSGPGIPTSTTTTAGSYYASSAYTVAPGRTISIGNTTTASTIVMAANTSITVPNGTSFTLINCNISCCAGMWKGIDVQSGGSLTLTNCTINNATIAAYSENGGSLAVTGCKFLNNVNHIAITDYSTGKLSANISGNTFGNLINMPSLSPTSFFTTLNNSNYGKMIYVNNITQGFATGSISSNRFDNYIPEANGWYASGVEFYNADSININTDSFGISGPNFDRGVYAENGNGSTSYLNFTANIFMGSSSAKTFRTGIVLNDVQNCGIGGSVGSHNVFKYLVNGIEYYQSSSISLANSVTYGDFENNTYGFVAAPGSHPVTVGSNNSLTNTLNVNIHCNKFINNDFGIIGCGNLLTQGSSGGIDAGNNFNKPTSSTSCNPGTPCPSLNSKADILWVTSGTTPVFYYYAPGYGFPGTITTSMASGSTAFNGSTVSSSSSGILGTSAANAGCYGTFKWDETSIAQKADSIASLNVYPNPSYNYFTVQLPYSGETVHYMMQVTDITGRRIYRCTAGNKPTETIDASAWASGAYFVTLVSETGKLYNVKIVKQQ